MVVQISDSFSETTWYYRPTTRRSISRTVTIITPNSRKKRVGVKMCMGKDYDANIVD